MSARTITNPGFLSDFYSRHTLVPDRPFCWVLGSGASVQSNIPTGGELVERWLAEIQEREDSQKLPLAQWATADNLRIKDFDYARAASFYPHIYRRRYEHYRAEGYAFLENAMENREPSYGYSVLARIMATTPHKAAVTTNFDNLIADALSIYTRKLPLVCGHESLTGFIRPNIQRPLVAKIHRDLLLNPKNEPEEIGKLPKEWVDALKIIFANYMPVVIGYGGNDGSLMHFLEALEPINGGIYWCYRPPQRLDPRVEALVEHHDGALVPIHGFDELMLQLNQKLGFDDPRPTLKATHESRVAEWQRQVEVLTKRLQEPAQQPTDEETLQPAREAAAAAVEHLAEEEDWWSWQLKANAEPDPDKAEKIYREALARFENSAELSGNFAVFLKDVRKDYDEAERLYRRALELDPGLVNTTGNFAVFLKDVRKNYDEAERLYRRALELDPNHANNTGNFANFLTDMREQHDEAERLYRRALELDPNHADHTGNFAVFLKDVRKNYDEAERLYRRALELDPNHANNTGNFANFLTVVRGQHEEAERLYRRAVQLAPEDDHWQKQLQRFLEEHPRKTPPDAAGKAETARRRRA